jgi:hypothetical protein
MDCRGFYWRTYIYRRGPSWINTFPSLYQARACGCIWQLFGAACFIKNSDLYSHGWVRAGLVCYWVRASRLHAFWYNNVDGVLSRQ